MKVRENIWLESPLVVLRKQMQVEAVINEISLFWSAYQSV